MRERRDLVTNNFLQKFSRPRLSCPPDILAAFKIPMQTKAVWFAPYRAIIKPPFLRALLLRGLVAEVRTAIIAHYEQNPALI